MKNLVLRLISLATVFLMLACGSEYNVKKPFCKQSFEFHQASGKSVTYQGEKSSGCQLIVGDQELVTEDLLYSKVVVAKDELNLAIASMVVTNSDPKNLMVTVTYANPVVEEGNAKNRTGSDILTEADGVDEIAPQKISVLVIRH